MKKVSKTTKIIILVIFIVRARIAVCMIKYVMLFIGISIGIAIGFSVYHYFFMDKLSCCGVYG